MKTDKKIEVPRTRDEINNALLESEIYKVAYRRGVEDGVMRGIIQGTERFYKRIKNNKHISDKSNWVITEDIYKVIMNEYLQTLEDKK